MVLFRIRRRSSVLGLLLFALFMGCASKGRYRVRPERLEQLNRPKSTITDVGLKVVFFDLGQADGMLIFHEGKTLLIDAGESRDFDDAKKYPIISKTLRSLTGRNHLDGFLLTHYHRDHVGNSEASSGLWGLMAEGLTIDTVYDRGERQYGGAPKGEVQRDYERSLVYWLNNGQVKTHRVLKVGDVIDLGASLKVEVVAANGNGLFEKLESERPHELKLWPASENDLSVALKLTYGDFELFTGGDLTGRTTHRDFKGHREGYHDVESSTAGRVGNVEVYRANHHGSQHSTNSCFLSVLSPEVSVVSSGRNGYGHPTQVVYDSLKRLGPVYITGGADERIIGHVSPSVVGGEVLIHVERLGKRYSVNGFDFESKSEEAEAVSSSGPKECETAPW